MLIFVVISFCQPNYHHLDFLKAVMVMPQFFNYHVLVWKEFYKSYTCVILGVHCNYAESLSAFA